MYRIGVDVGGTNTDAAILDVTALETPGRGVLATCKATTTADITSGIASAIETVLAQSGGAAKADVLSVNIGTTHFVNALVEADARRLGRVAVVRLCGPFTRAIPPFSDFPVGLRRIMDGGAWYLDGGLEIDGRPIAAPDPDQIRRCVAEVRAAGVGVVALVGVFSMLDHAGEHEDAVRRQMREIDPALDVVCSHDIGPVGFLERENATILNAAILATSRRTVRGFKAAMRRLALDCPLYLSQNDGTLVGADEAAEFPIKTFASGPTNSMTGAAFLAGLDKPRAVPVDKQDEASAGEPQHQVIVVDIGGTTTDVCALLPSGFPRQAPNFVEVGGVRTAFSMPEVMSIGLGGGSKIGTDPQTGEVTVGPDSVGHFLTEQALIFGGPTLTTSDIAVASGKVQLGDPSKTSGVPSDTVLAAEKRIKQMLESVIEQMKVSAAPVHVLLVGGGSLLVTGELSNVAKCEKPIHHDAANAVGAAIAKVASEVDVIEILEGKDEKAAVKKACQKAVGEAVRKGAAPDDVKIVAIDKVALQYTSNKATRLIVKAVGRLSTPLPGTQTPPLGPHEGRYADEEEKEEEEEGAKIHVADAAEPVAKPSRNVDLNTYQPEVRDGTWYISEVDLELIATGTGILGTGGGGPSYHELLKGLHILRNGGAGKMRVISPEALKSSDLVCFGSWYGAPSVINERLADGNEITNGIDALSKVLGFSSYSSILADEIGGMNGMSTFPTGVKYDIPVIDGDAMGRAYPTMYHATMYVYGQPITPCALADAKGNVSIIMNADSPVRVERMLRTTAVELGLGCAVCAKPLPGDVVQKYAVPNTVSQAWYLGRAVHLARRNKSSFTDAIFSSTTGRVLFVGKIIDVRRDIGGGYTMGSVLIAPLSSEEQDSTSDSTANTDQRHMMIPFQNEFLYAAYTDASGSEEGEIVCTVPDLISILGQDGEAIGSQELRYGLRVSVIAMPAHPLWKTEEGLKVGGPEGFGLKMPFTGVGEYAPPQSVIAEFGSTKEQ